MHVSLETPAHTEQRLRRVAKRTVVELRDGEWWYEEFPVDQFPGRVRSDAIALVRDESGWCQLVPVRSGDHPHETFRIWSCHFPDGMDNSGFIGWLAARIKARTGSGVFVVCGLNTDRGGVYDYWGCPADAAPSVLAELFAITAEAPRGGSLDGRRMRAVATADAGEVDTDTLFTFSQDQSTVWAHYAGGAVRVGYLVGVLTPGRLTFRYSQIDRKGDLHGGRSTCEVEYLPDGRLRLLEHFEWESRDGGGTNVIEEIDGGAR